MLAKIRNLVFSFGDSDLLNDFIFTNYSGSITYFDDDMEKTALYLDTLSSGDIFTSYIKRTQNYELMSISYLPCYAFKKFCSGMMAINARHEYPRELRNMFFEQKRYENLNDRLLDLKDSKNGYSKGTEVNDEERYKLSQHSSIHNSMRRVDFKKDILPFIYIIIHPNIRDINTQLFTKHEKQAFQTAIEIMVMFDVKLKDDSLNLDSQVASFEPDIGSLVTFKNGRNEFMRNKTQILVLQNYELVK
jgi:hypothetical protein